MAVPFNLPSEQESAQQQEIHPNNYNRLDQLLWDLYEILRIIIYGSPQDGGQGGGGTRGSLPDLNPGGRTPFPNRDERQGNESGAGGMEAAIYQWKTLTTPHTHQYSRRRRRGAPPSPPSNSKQTHWDGEEGEGGRGGRWSRGDGPSTSSTHFPPHPLSIWFDVGVQMVQITQVLRRRNTYQQEFEGETMEEEMSVKKKVELKGSIFLSLFDSPSPVLSRSVLAAIAFYLGWKLITRHQNR